MRRLYTVRCAECGMVAEWVYQPPLAETVRRCNSCEIKHIGIQRYAKRNAALRGDNWRWKLDQGM